MSTLRTTHWNRERTQNIIIITLLGIPGKQILEAMLIAARERIWQVEFAPKHSCLFVPPPPPRPPSVPLPHQQQSDPQFFIWTESPFVLHAEGMEEDFSGAWVALGEQMTLTGPTDVLCRGSRMFSLRSLVSVCLWCVGSGRWPFFSVPQGDSVGGRRSHRWDLYHPTTTDEWWSLS